MATRNRCFYEKRIEDERWYGMEPCKKPGCSAWDRAEAIKKAEEERKRRLDKPKK